MITSLWMLYLRIWARRTTCFMIEIKFLGCLLAPFINHWVEIILRSIHSINDFAFFKSWSQMKSYNSNPTCLTKHYFQKRKEPLIWSLWYHHAELSQPLLYRLPELHDELVLSVKKCSTMLWIYTRENKVNLLATGLTDAVARGSTSKVANSWRMGFPSSFSMVPQTCKQQTKTKTKMNYIKSCYMMLPDWLATKMEMLMIKLFFNLPFTN